MAGIGQPIRHDSRPLHAQATEALTKMMEGGQFKPGDRLPSEDALARQLGISRSTLRQAMGYLETHGLVSRRQGLGTFVSVPDRPGLLAGLERLETFRSLAIRAGLVPEVAERKVQVAHNDRAMRSVMNLDEETELVRVQVVEAVNGVRSIYIDDYIPATVATRDLLDTYEGPVFDILKRRVKDPLSHTRTELFAIGADLEVASKLFVPVGKPVLHFSQIHFCRAGKPIAASKLYILTDQFHFYLIRRPL